MTFNKRLKATSNLFVLSVIGIAVLAIIGMGLALYSAEVFTFGKKASSSELHNAVKDNEALVEYLNNEKDNEAHFIAIANLVSEEKRADITRAFIISSIPIIIISFIAAYLVAKRLLKPVKEAYESQEKFLQDAAHELRNPIAAINLALENSTTTNMTTKKQKELLRMVGRQTRRLVRINEDLLYLERRTAGEPVKEINLSELLQDVIEGFKIYTNKRDINLDINIQEGIMKKMRANDFIKLSRNLIENAIKYSEDGSSVQITLNIEKSKIFFIVKDHGIGIPKDEIINLSERFYRASNSGKFEGSGLGLAIVNKVVYTYGGKMIIESEEGKGTTAKSLFLVVYKNYTRSKQSVNIASSILRLFIN